MEGRKRGGGRERISGAVSGRLSGKRSRDQCGADFSYLASLVFEPKMKDENSRRVIRGKQAIKILIR